MWLDEKERWCCKVKQLSGFTLIELLIVVAIIGILAAIAIPNFLLAQTRAKVSAAKAEMQSSTTALEAYYVDENAYPPMRDRGSATFHARLSSYMTTPVSYVRRCFHDPFMTFENPLNIEDVDKRYTYFNYYQFKTDPTLSMYYSATRHAGAGEWLIYSWGPDKNMNSSGVSAGDDGAYTNYDPTNGVVSIGNIIRTHRNAEGYYPP